MERRPAAVAEYVGIIAPGTAESDGKCREPIKRAFVVNRLRNFSNPSVLVLHPRGLNFGPMEWIPKNVPDQDTNAPVLRVRIASRIRVDEISGCRSGFFRRILCWPGSHGCEH